MVNIFSTRHTPYARLSNNFKQKMRIGGVTYPTATNYIYANMLKTPEYRLIISQARPQSTCTGEDGCSNHKRSKTACMAANCTYEFSSIGDQFSELYEQEQNNRRTNAIETALNAKLEQYPKLAQILLDTGNKSIIYVSPSKWMGTGGDANDGKNNYGKLLGAARDKLVGERDQRIRLKSEHVREDNIYRIYIAYTNMARLIRTGDNLDVYDGKTASEILTMMKDQDIEISYVPSKEVIVEEAKKKRYGVGPSEQGGILNPDMFIALKKPRVLSCMVRGKYLAKEREKKLQSCRGLILNMYCDYLLKRSAQFGDLDPEDYTKARNQQFKTVSKEVWYKAARDIENLYREGMLSESLSKEIDESIQCLNIPSEEEVKDAEEMVAAIRNSIKDEKQTSKMLYQTSDDKVLVFAGNPPSDDATYELNGLTPLDTDTGMIKIGGRAYPSITYYCIAVELANCCIGTQGTGETLPSKAYEMLKEKDSASFLKLSVLEDKLNKLKSKFYAKKLMNNAKVILQKKFDDRNRINQNVLLSTKKDELVWDDRNDPILGTKPPDKFNFVGKELMKLRDSIRRDRKRSGDLTDLQDVLSLKVLTKLFQNDFLKGWVNMRVRDMCNVILITKDYLYVKYKIIQELTPEFVTDVIDNVYQPCSHIVAVASEINSYPPDVFITMVQNYKSFLQFTNEPVKVLDILWKRVAVVIYYLIKHLENSTSNNIAIVLKNVEALASLPKNCPEIIPDKRENCIFSAILNIINGINTIDKSYGHQTGLKEVDFSTAVTILLNVNSLAEQQAKQRKTDKGPLPTIPPPPPVTKVTEEDIINIRAKFGGSPYFYNEDIINKVIEEIISLGQVPSDTELQFLFMNAEFTPPKTVFKPPSPPKNFLGPISIPNLPEEHKDELQKPPEEEDLEFEEDDDEEDLEFDVEYDDDDDDEDDPPFTPDPRISANIRQAFLYSDIDIENVGESLVFMVDDAINFVNSYKAISHKTKTNRINFFAVSNLGMSDI